MKRKSKRRKATVILVQPRNLNGIREDQGLWHESEVEKERWASRANERAALMRWVRKRMERRLTPFERQCIERHFLEGLSYRAIAEDSGAALADVQRAIRRGLAQLRYRVQRRDMILRANARRQRS